METEDCCPVCGDVTIGDYGDSNNVNETNTAVFAKSQEFRTVFQCFLKLFEVTNPPWLEKRLVFCQECKRQLTAVSELEQALKEIEKRLKESEKVVQDKFKSSEGKFQSSGVYWRDQRYWKVREQFLGKHISN